MKTIIIFLVATGLYAQDVPPTIPLDVQRDVAVTALDAVVAQQAAQQAQDKASKSCGANYQPQRRGTEFVCVAKPEPNKEPAK